jgi:hypothetical protein
MWVLANSLNFDCVLVAGGLQVTVCELQYTRNPCSIRRPLHSPNLQPCIVKTLNRWLDTTYSSCFAVTCLFAFTISAVEFGGGWAVGAKFLYSATHLDELRK